MFSSLKFFRPSDFRARGSVTDVVSKAVSLTEIKRFPSFMTGGGGRFPQVEAAQSDQKIVFEWCERVSERVREG